MLDVGACEVALHEAAIRAAFQEAFQIEQFEECLGRGENGESTAEMHWARMIKK